MKKAFLRFFIFVFCIFVFTTNTKAIDINEFVGELIEEVTEEDIVLDTVNDNYNTINSNKYPGAIETILYDRVILDNVNNRVDVLSCTSTSCYVEFVRYNPEDYSYYSKKDTVAIKIKGFVINDIVEANVGNTVTLNYRFLDNNFQEKPIELKRVNIDYRYEDYANVTDDNKIEVLKQGIIPVELAFVYNGETYWKRVYVLSELNSIINTKINAMNDGFYSNRARFSYYSNPIDVAEDTFVEEIIGDSYLDYRKTSNTTCNTAECEENIVMNFNFKFYINDKEFTVQKNNVNVTEYGIKFNNYYYPALDLTLGTPYDLDYSLYSKTANWMSTNTSVATVDNNGRITPVGEGACVIVASVENGMFESVVVRVKPTVGTFRNRLNTLLHQIFDGVTTFNSRSISTINEDVISEIVYSDLYDYVYEKLDDENIGIILNLSDDMRTMTVSLGYHYYDMELPNGDFEHVSYCKSYTYDEDGLDCNVDEIELEIVYPDEDANFDNTILTKAQALLTRIDNNKDHYVYLNDVLVGIIENMNNYTARNELMSRLSDFNKEIENEDGFTFLHDGRMGSYAVGYGYGYITKNRVIYASTAEMVPLFNAIGVPGNPTTDADKLAAVAEMVNSRVDTSKYKYEIMKLPQEALDDPDDEREYYRIIITDKSDEEKYIYLFGILVTGYDENEEPEIPNELEITTDKINDVVYTGSALTPAVKVYANGMLLTVNRDYSVRYVDNVNVGISKVYISTLNDQMYGFDEFYVEFNITKPTITNESVTVPTSLAFTGNELVVNVAVKVNGRILVKDTDYDLTLENLNGKVGEQVTVTVEGKGNYTGSVVKTVLIIGKVVVPNIAVAKGNENTLVLTIEEQDFADEFYVYRSTDKKKYTKVATLSEGNVYTDTNLTYGTTYYYKVVAHNQYDTSDYSNVVSEKPMPAKVNNLAVAGVTTTSVKLSYDKVNATGYEIHYGTSASKMSLTATVKSSDTLTYTKTGLKANTTYYFKVRAYKTVGKTIVYGDFSNVVSVKTGPSAPSVTVSNKDYKSLSIKINSVTGGVNYKLEVSTDKTNYSLVEELPVAGVYVHSDLTPGMTYYYRAKACNSEGSCGSYSSVVSKKVIPNAPVLTVNKNTENKLMIKVNEQEGVTGYHIYRSTSKTKNFKKVGSTETTEYLDTNLTYGTTYYYKAVAYNENSESAYSNVASGKTVPETVENLKVDSVTSTSIKVSYDKVNATGYEVYYGTSTKSMKKATTISKADTLSYNKTSLKANTTYYFKVRAYKKIGSKKVYGSYSSILTVKTAPAVPKVTLSLKNYDALSLKINASSGATKYMVTYSYNNDFSEPVNLLYEDANTYTLDGLDFGKTVYLKARACNASDGCSSWVTLNKKVTTLVPAFTLKTSSKAVTVTLTSVDGASGYEIYRSNYSNKKFSLVKTFTTEDELLEFVNSTSKGKKYYYKVRSYKVVDDVTIYSDYSSVKNIKSK